MATETLKIVIDTVYRGARQSEQARRDLERMDDASERASDRFHRFARRAAAVTAALGTVAVGAKLTYDQLKQGAALELATIRFDALAGSIGVASDALLVDMRAATSGMVSDAELITGATDLINVGIARNADEVLRFSSVVGRLGIDMQQLTLTIVNQSKLRLDALGLSVEAVDAKFQDFRRTMSDEEAWRLAVLESLEEKTALFGDAADSSAGKLATFEAAVANLGRVLQLELVDRLDWVVEGLTIIAKAASGEYADAIEQQVQDNIAAAMSLHELGTAYQQTADALRSGSGLVGATDELLAAQDEIINKAALIAGDEAGFLAWFDALGGETTNVATGMSDLEQELRAYALAAFHAARRTAGLTEAGGNLADEMEQIADVAGQARDVYIDQDLLLRDLFASTRVYTDLLEENEANEKARAEALELSRERLEMLREAQEAATERLGDYFAAAVEAKDNTFDMNEELFRAVDAAGGSAHQLAILGVATGKFTEEQAIAALKVALVREKIDDLARLIKEGKMSIPEALDALTDFQEGLDNATKDVDSLDEATRRLDGALRGLPKNIAIEVVTRYIQEGQIGPVTVPGGSQIRAAGDPSFPGGLTSIAEFGRPELVALPQGSRIFSQNSTTNLTNNLNVTSSRKVARILHAYMRRQSRPQTVLG